MANTKNNSYTDQDIKKVISLIEDARNQENLRIKEFVDKMVEDPTPNFWDIIFHKTSALNFVKKAHEIRYSAMLAWLANPNENHKLGNMFIRELLKKIYESDPDEISKINKNFADNNKESVTVEANDISVRNEYKNIDVYYKNKNNNSHVAIEVKQYALEHDSEQKNKSQLQKYKEIVEKEAKSIDKDNSLQYLLFLTPLGTEPSEGNEAWISVDYAAVIFVLDKMIDANHDLDFVKIVKDFKQELERTSMNLDFDDLKADIKKAPKDDQEFLIKDNQKFLIDFAKKLEEDPDLSQDFNKVLFEKGLNVKKMRESLNLISNSFYKQDHTKNPDVQKLMLELVKYFTKLPDPEVGVKYKAKFQGNDDIIFDYVATTQSPGQGIKFSYQYNKDEYWTYFSGGTAGLVPSLGCLSLAKNDDHKIYEVKLNKIKAKEAINDTNTFNKLINDFTQALTELSDYVKENIKNN